MIVIYYYNCKTYTDAEKVRAFFCKKNGENMKSIEKTILKVVCQSVQSMPLHRMRQTVYNKLHLISFTIYYKFTLHFL